MADLDPRATLVVFGFFAFAILLLSVIATYDFRRRRGLAAVAQENGFTYEREVPGLLEIFEKFRMFPVGTNRRITNVLSGERDNMRVWLLDYSYFAGRTSGGRNQFTVCAVRSPDLRLPWFSLRCSVPGIGRLEREAARALGERPARFGDEEFERKFVVHGRPESVEALLDTDLRQHLRRFAETLVRIEAQGDLLLFTTGQSVLPRDAQQVICDAVELAAMFAARGEAVGAVRTGVPGPPVERGGARTREDQGLSIDAPRGAASPRWATVGRPLPRVVLFVVGACLLVAGGRLMLNEINASIAGTVQPLSRTFVVGLVCLVSGLGACLRSVFEGVQKRRKQRRVGQDLQALSSLERPAEDRVQTGPRRPA